jgi:hypothetical protein
VGVNRGGEKGGKEEGDVGWENEKKIGKKGKIKFCLLRIRMEMRRIERILKDEES